MPRILVAIRTVDERTLPNGQWIDLDDGDAVRGRIARMLSAYPQQGAYWRVLAYDGLPDFGPHPDVNELLAYLDAVDEYGEPFEKLWMSRTLECVIRAADMFADCYQGTYPDAGTWARHYLALTGELAQAATEFDFAAYACQAEDKGEVWFVAAANGGIHVFWSD